MAKDTPKPAPKPEPSKPAKDPYDKWTERLRSLFLFGIGSFFIIQQFSSGQPNIEIIGGCFILCGLPYFIRLDEKDHRRRGKVNDE
jgi:hypothetical protein